MPEMKINADSALLPEDRIELDRRYRESLDPRLVEDWEQYVGDTLESAGLVDEFDAAWKLAKARFERPAPAHPMLKVVELVQELREAALRGLEENPENAWTKYLQRGIHEDADQLIAAIGNLYKALGQDERS